MYMRTPRSERYLVLVEREGVTSSPGTDVSRAEAWVVARRLKLTGARVWIMRVDGERPECVVADDEIDEVDEGAAPVETVKPATSSRKPRARA